MGLLDLIGGVLGQQQQPGAQNSGMAQVLTQLLAGQGQGQGQGQGYGQSQGGGLAGLVDRFRNAGLGHVADSWVNHGPNQPVSPGQLRQVFGDEQVEQMADQSGMPEGNFLSQLSQHLPRAVDRMTPNGQIPEEGTISV
jgi:uncharacterized protein YidB (DUF937 family)